MTVLRNYWMYEAQDGTDSRSSRAALAQGLWPRFPGMPGASAVRVAAAPARYAARPRRAQRQRQPCAIDESHDARSARSGSRCSPSRTRRDAGRRPLGRHAGRAADRRRPCPRRPRDRARRCRGDRRAGSTPGSTIRRSTASSPPAAPASPAATSRPRRSTRVADKEIPGFGELFRWLSYATIGTSTIQSRASACVARGTYIFALPGSTGAVKDGWDGILAQPARQPPQALQLRRADAAAAGAVIPEWMLIAALRRPWTIDIRGAGTGFRSRLRMCRRCGRAEERRPPSPWMARGRGHCVLRRTQPPISIPPCRARRRPRGRRPPNALRHSGAWPLQRQSAHGRMPPDSERNPPANARNPPAIAGWLRSGRQRELAPRRSRWRSPPCPILSRDRRGR